MDAEAISAVLKALSDPNRMRIFQMLLEGELCGCELLRRFDFTQPSLSHHMSVLQRCGLIIGHKDGQWVHYSVDRAIVDEICDFFSKASLKLNGKSN